MAPHPLLLGARNTHHVWVYFMHASCLSSETSYKYQFIFLKVSCFILEQVQYELKILCPHRPVLPPDDMYPVAFRNPHQVLLDGRENYHPTTPCTPTKAFFSCPMSTHSSKNHVSSNLVALNYSFDRQQPT